LPVRCAPRSPSRTAGAAVPPPPAPRIARPGRRCRRSCAEPPQTPPVHRGATGRQGADASIPDAHRPTGSPVRTPLVTVILPAKDAAPYIGTTLETLLRQFDDPGSLTLAAVDDGSTDGTGARMRSYAERCAHAEGLVKPRAVGLASARNQGLAHAEGDAFCCIDGDEWMQPRRLQVLASRLQELGCDFLRTDHVRVTGSARKIVRAPS